MTAEHKIKAIERLLERWPHAKFAGASDFFKTETYCLRCAIECILSGKTKMEEAMKPLGDKVVVRPIEPKKVESLIEIPESCKEKPQVGEVLAVGPGRMNLSSAGGVIPMSVKAGDKVLFGKYSGTEVEIPEGKVLILREEEILLVL